MLMSKEMHKEKILITGATGLIGSSLVKKLLDVKKGKFIIIAVIRSIQKAERIFSDYKNSNLLKFIVCDDITTLPKIEDNIDYIIHGANPTASSYFVDNPVETILTGVIGTDKILRLAREKSVKGIVFLSTMEVYGTPRKGLRIVESENGCFDSTTVRNCYPLSKQVCENLCCSYVEEYGVKAKIARLTQTFGPGVEYNDRRIFAEFARCAIEKRNIKLKTKGETERCYLYSGDAVDGILTILFDGEIGQVYTVANESTYCSIYKMASIVAQKYDIEVEIQEEDVKEQGYPDTLYMDLDTTKLRSLGWKPTVGLEEMYESMIEAMKQSLYM